MLMVAHVGEGGVKIGQKRAHVVYGRSLRCTLFQVYSGVPITRACSPRKFLVIFQPARPILLHKNEQGGQCYLVR